MKVVIQKLDRLLKISAAAGLLLMGQQALAVGTDAGTEIINDAVITYEVNNVQQNQETAGATFRVDRVVNFTLDTANAALTPTAPGETGAIVLYTLTNIGNSPLDFRLLAENASGDDDDMAGGFVAFVDTNANGVVDVGELDFVDALPEGDTVTITVIADAPNVVTDGETALVQLSVFAADPYDGSNIVNPGANLTLGDDLVDGGVDATTVITSVFDEDGPGVGGDGSEVFSTDGYQFESASLTVGKTSAVVSDPVGSGFAIPGAIIEYTVDITNGGSSATTSLTITDDIQSDLNFQIAVAAYGAPDENVRIVFTDDSAGSTTTSFCEAEFTGTDTNGDGCVVDPTGGTGGIPRLTISAPAMPNLDPSDSVDVQFRAEIDNS